MKHEYESWVEEMGVGYDEECLKQDTKTILTPSLPVFALEIQELARKGYVIDPERLPAMFGFQYECGMIYYNDGKPTRKEVLEKAREAKKQKAIQKQTNGEQDE